MKRNKLVFCFIVLALFLFQIACNFGGSSSDIEAIKVNWANAFDMNDGGALENVTIFVEGSVVYPNTNEYREPDSPDEFSQVIAGGLKKDGDLYFATIGSDSAYAQKVSSGAGTEDYRYATKTSGYYDDDNYRNKFVWTEIPSDLKEYVDTAINLFEEELTDLKNNPLSSTESDGAFSFRWTFNDNVITFKNIDYSISLDTKIYFTSSSDKIDRIKLDGIVTGKKTDGSSDEYKLNCTLHFKNYGKTNLFVDNIVEKVNAQDVKRIVLDSNLTDKVKVNKGKNNNQNIILKAMYYDQSGNLVISKTPANIYINDVYFSSVSEYDNRIYISLNSTNLREGENTIKAVIGEAECEIVLDIEYVQDESKYKWALGSYFYEDTSLAFVLSDNSIILSNGVNLIWDKTTTIEEGVKACATITTRNDYYDDNGIFGFRVTIANENEATTQIITCQIDRYGHDARVIIEGPASGYFDERRVYKY